MKIVVSHRGQLALATGVPEEEIDVESGSTVGSVLEAASERHGEAFSKFVFDESGAMRNTLLVAIDGEQVTSEDEVLGDGAMEITLMPPIAGG